MAWCNILGTTRLDFGIISIQHFLTDLPLLRSDIDIVNFADDNTYYRNKML